MADTIRVESADLLELSLKFEAMKAGTSEMEDSVFRDAADLVASRSRGKVPIGPSEGGHAVSSIMALDGNVMEGGADFPYMGWLDFGGSVGIKNMVFRPYIGRGRFIWATLGDDRERLDRMYQDGLADLARRSGLDVE